MNLGDSMKREVKVGEVYRHFKGHICKIICIAKDSETEKDVVVYEHNNTNWVRDYEMFLSKVDKNKYPNVEQTYRFEKINEE